MADDFMTGAGTKIRFAVLAAGSRARPADTDFKVLKLVTTSEIKYGATDVTTFTYDSGMAEDGKVTKTNWMLSASGNIAATAANRTATDLLKTAVRAGQEVWVERLLPGDTKWEGGVASITSLSAPAPSDNIVTFASEFKGRGPAVDTADTP